MAPGNERVPSSVLGFVNVFKPPGMTSAQVGAFVRRLFPVRADKLAVGHLGTLDPDASGVLPLALGKATRLLPLITDHRKTYVCTIVFGRATSTGDATGETIASGPIYADLAARLDATIPRFIGEIAQVAPMFSAVHHEGRRLYELARAGLTVERKSRNVTIYGMHVLGWRDNAARVRISCSEGTYIRTLCENIGTALGSAAHMGTLLREASGPFVLFESRMLEEIATAPYQSVIAPERIVPIPTIVLDEREAMDFRAGRVVPLPGGVTAGHIFVRDPARALVGVGEALGTMLAPRKVFA